MRDNLKLTGLLFAALCMVSCGPNRSAPFYQACLNQVDDAPRIVSERRCDCVSEKFSERGLDADRTMVEKFMATAGDQQKLSDLTRTPEDREKFGSAMRKLGEIGRECAATTGQ